MPRDISEKQTLLKSLPVGDEELYTTYKKLEAHLEFLQLQEVCFGPRIASQPELKDVEGLNNDSTVIPIERTADDVGIHPR